MIYKIKKIHNFKIKTIFKIQNFKIKKKKKKEIIEILLFKMLINFRNKINFKSKLKILKIRELNKEEIDFQIFLLRAIQLKRTFQKKTISKVMMMMILKILQTMTQNHNLMIIMMTNLKQINKKNKLIS